MRMSTTAGGIRPGRDRTAGRSPRILIMDTASLLRSSARAGVWIAAMVRSERIISCDQAQNNARPPVENLGGTSARPSAWGTLGLSLPDVYRIIDPVHGPAAARVAE